MGRMGWILFSLVGLAAAVDVLPKTTTTVGAAIAPHRMAILDTIQLLASSLPPRSLDASLSARYVFDRVLGSNTFAPETPRQRPFEYDVIPVDPKFEKPRILEVANGTLRLDVPLDSGLNIVAGAR